MRGLIALLGILGVSCDAPGPPRTGPAEPDASAPESVVGPAVRPALVSRLTAAQYENIVFDTLGVALTEAERDPARGGIPIEKNSVGLFQNAADGQAASDAHTLAFATRAELVAAQVTGAVWSSLLPCESHEAGCRDPAIRALGLRLFRRPLTPRETQLYASLYDEIALEGAVPQSALRGVLVALLQAPAFLFKQEAELIGGTGESRPLDGFELASRLGFFIWNSAPDAELLGLATRGELSGRSEHDGVLLSQLHRMLADPKAKRMVRQFVADFAETERAAFDGMTPEVRALLFDSLASTAEVHLLQKQATIPSLFTTTEFSLSPEVAQFIGLSTDHEGHRVLDVSSLPERVGWLSHPAFIAGFGDTTHSSIVGRGISLMVKLMCRQPLAVPDTLAPQIRRFSAEFQAQSERERSEERMRMAKPVAEGGDANPLCWGCHSQFEPLAYGFERFDAAGRYLGLTDDQGRPIRIDGWLTDDLTTAEEVRTRYQGMAGYMTALKNSEVVQNCMAEHWIAYATGRAATPVEKEWSAFLGSRLKGSMTLPALAEAIVTSDLFRHMKPASHPVEEQ